MLDLPREPRLMQRRAIGSVVLVGLAALMLTGCTAHPGQVPLDSAVWRQGDPLVRSRMIEDVLVDVKPGMTREQVESLLGTGTILNTPVDAGDNRLSGTETESYYLGPGYEWQTGDRSWDDMYLYVSFDGDRVIEVRLDGF